MSRHRVDLKEVEQSPDGRYLRFDEKLGNGAYKEVYLAYDTETGKEVAWNTVEMRRLPANEKRRIRSETEILAELQHPHIINFYHVWENKAKEQICFTTEIVTSGTLKQYTNRVKSIKLKVIKKWCRQILTALDYLHSHVPPIIHRDLKCDNIFINGGTGEIRLGDFGLSAHRTCTHVASVLGTPEFMAPELYEENYSESVDIYAFGMAVLEMVSKEYPYEECSNAAQIWKKVMSGSRPDVLQRVHDNHVRRFIELCIMSDTNRLSAAELLAHPFLAFRKSDAPVRENLVVTVEPKVKANSRPGSKPSSQGKQEAAAAAATGGRQQQQTPTQSPTAPRPSPQPGLQSLFHPSPSSAAAQQQQMRPQTSHTAGKPHGGDGRSHPYALPSNAYGDGPPATAPPGPMSLQSSGASSISSTSSYSSTSSTLSSASTGVSAILVEIESAHGPTANIVLHIHLDGGRRKKQIKFALDFRHDTSMSLAGEMVSSLKLPDGERTQMMIAAAMENRIDPVRKQYFAMMANESSSPISATDMQDESQHPQAVFQHTSYTAATPVHATSGMQQPAQMQQPQQPQRPQTSQPSGVHRAPVAAGAPTLTKPPTGAPPSVSPLPPHPSNTTAGSVRINTAPAGGATMAGSAALPLNARPPQQVPMTAGPRPSPPSGAMGRPSTAGPGAAGRATMPASMSASMTAAAAAAAANVSANNAGNVASAVPSHKHSGSSSALPTSSAPSSPAMATGALPAGGPSPLLTLSSFSSSEEFESYLRDAFKSLSVSVLKERIRASPGGNELIKACFEKPDLIQMLVRIHLQAPQQQAQEQKQQQAGPGQLRPPSSQSFNTSPPQAQPRDPQHSPASMQSQQSQQHGQARPHVSFTSSSSSISNASHSSLLPDFLSPDPHSAHPASPRGAYASAGSGSMTSRNAAAGGGGGGLAQSHPAHLSPDPFHGLDSFSVDAVPPLHSAFSTSHISADHRFAQGGSGQQQAAGAASLLDMDAPSPSARPVQQHSESARHSSQAGGGAPQHHAHRSIDTPTGSSMGMGGGGGVSAFPFALSNDNNNDALSPRALQQERSPPQPQRGRSGVAQAQHHHHHSHSGNSSDSVVLDDPVPSSQEGPTAFDFQVSVSSPVATPDIGLDAGLDGSDGLDGGQQQHQHANQHGRAQTDLDAFLSPASAPQSTHNQTHRQQQQQQQGLSLQTHHHHHHHTGAGHALSEPSSAPNSKAHSDPFSYDLLTRPATSGAPANGTHAAKSTSSHAGVQGKSSSSQPTAAQLQERERVRLATSLGGVLEQEDPLTSLADTGATRALSPNHRLEDTNLTDLLGGGGVEDGLGAKVPASAASETDLHSFFTKSARRTDLLDPASANHLIPGNTLMDQLHEQQQMRATAAYHSATLPGQLGELADMWAQPNVDSGMADGVSATGTRSSRTHTGADPVDLDAFFVPRAAASGSSSSTAAGVAGGASGAPPHVAAAHINPAAIAPGPPLSKQQRTKSEADQAEQAILSFQL